MNSPVAGRLGRFTLSSELGRGAMGVVYTAIHPGLGVPVAVKVLSESYSRDESFRTRFQREAATVASLNHPGIVRVYDFDSDDGALFIVMELVEGRSLRYWLSQSGRFRSDVALDLIQQLLSAVGAAHSKGVVHRDLKPDNVLISTQGKTKILDFGISKWVGDAHGLTATGAMVGTPSYMAPEQVKSEELDHRADIYALGCILYELLHGEPPFVGAMPSVLHAQVFGQPRPSTVIPDGIFAIIRRATAKAPGDRFQTCEEFAGALLQATRPDLDKPSAPPAGAPPAQTASSLRHLLGAALRRPGVAGADLKGPGGCSYGGCSSNEGWACAYVDAKGQQCSSWWCKKHVVFVDAVPFCPRHSSVLRALSATAGTIREIKHRPEVSDRALPLANMVADDVDRDLNELIHRRYKGQPGVQFGREGTIRQTWEGRGQVAWERSWSAHRNQGYITRIAVRVSMAEPDTVKVAIGQTVVFSAVPDWIARRREGHPPDPADRARFRQHVVDAVLQQIDAPAPVTNPQLPAVPADTSGSAPGLDLGLAEGMVLRALTSTSRLTAFEVAEQMAVPYATIEPALNTLTTGNFIDSLGIDAGPGAASARPLPERMAYAVTTNGRSRLESLPGTRYSGPAPVTLKEFQAACRDANRPAVLTEDRLNAALGGLEMQPAVLEAIRAAVNSRGSLFIYGAPGNGKTSLARRLAALLGDPVLMPVAVDLGGGDVMRVFDPASHRLADGSPPLDRRWRRVERPLVQVGGEFMLEMLEPTWEPASRTYEAPLQVKALGGVLLIDDLGRQRMPPKAILDRLLVPLEQRVDYLNLSTAGRKLEVPFEAQVVLSTNLSPADLLDEAYLRRLAYKVLMPDPSWDAWLRIFERERERSGIAAEPRALELIQGLYGERPRRGNHPRDLLDRLRNVAAARGVEPALRPELIEAAWQTLFVAQ